MEFRTEEIKARPWVFIRVPTTLAEIGEKIGACLGRVGPHVGDRAAGAPIARWVEWDQEKLAGAMEVGVPVREPVAGDGDIEAGELPGGRAAVGEHVGPYDQLNATWQRFGPWITEQGLEGRDAPWEEYLSDPGVTPQEECVTRLVWPV